MSLADGRDKSGLVSQCAGCNVVCQVDGVTNVAWMRTHHRPHSSLASGEPLLLRVMSLGVSAGTRSAKHAYTTSIYEFVYEMLITTVAK